MHSCNGHLRVDFSTPANCNFPVNQGVVVMPQRPRYTVLVPVLTPA